MRPRALLAAAALVLAPRLALAQSVGPSLDLRGFRAPTDPGAGLYLEPADSPGTGDWNAGLWFSYAYLPITLRDAKSGDIAFDVIQHQVSADAAVSVGIAHRMALGFDLPVVLYQVGDTPDARSRRVLGDTPLPAQAFGDLGLNGKFTLMRPTGGEFGGVAVAVHERFTLPTGDKSSYVAEGGVTSETRLLVEYRLVAVGVHAAAGLKLRAEAERFACNGVSDPNCPSRFGHEFPFGLGLSLKPQIFGIDPKGHVTLYLESHGHLPLSPISPFDSTAASSLQLGLGARYAIRDVSFLAGVETSAIGGVGDAPFRGILSASWAPRAHDIDGDGIEDEVDQCRELAEDRDGFQDEDGCPDGDNDDDGVPDKSDKCPLVKEDEDGFQDEDGCPDPDNDGDKILDKNDACPNEAGVPSADPKKNGCPFRDPDGDGIESDKDQCPTVPEDKDGFQDEDGCPDPDNDGDGVLDAEDKCPTVKGVVSEKGCPDPDADKDSYQDQEDKCPTQPEVWNGFQDEDGCPDEVPAKAKARPPVTVKEVAKKGPSLEVSQAVKFTAANEVEASSLPMLRALSAELLAHPTWSVSIGVRVSPKGGEAEAKARAAAVVAAVRRFTRSEKAATAVDFGAVKAAPRAAEFGLGLLLVAPETTTAAVVAQPDKGATVKAPAPKPSPKK